MKPLKFILTAALYFVYTISEGQDMTGIYFENNLSWSEIKAKAKIEDKYIFIDCYASWCVPCKKMDMEVYPVDSIGKFVNEHFISVRCQFDTSKNDAKEIQSWYIDARNISMEYKISAFPTFLFLTPDGRLAQRDIGLKSIREFKELAKRANDGRQYFALLEKYKKGEVDYKTLPDFVDMTKYYDGYVVPDSLIENYFHKYLPSLADNQIFTRQNLLFAGSQVRFIHEGDRLFQLFYNDTPKADSLTFKSYSRRLLATVVYIHEIGNKLWSDPSKGIPFTREPDWKAMAAIIAKKYGQPLADSLIQGSQIDFYFAVRDFKKYAKLVDALIKKYPPSPDPDYFVDGPDGRFWHFIGGAAQGHHMDIMALNILAWKTFLMCDDKDVLEKAIRWSDLSIRLGNGTSKNIFFGGNTDTKANLLYKMGKVKEAIKLLEDAMKKDVNNKSFSKTISKMQKGEPTWPLN